MNADQSKARGQSAPPKYKLLSELPTAMVPFTNATTADGCKCADVWSFGGYPFTGCVFIPREGTPDFPGSGDKDKPFCEPAPDEEQTLVHCKSDVIPSIPPRETCTDVNGAHWNGLA